MSALITNLTSPLFIKVPLLSQETSGVSILPLSYDFLLDSGNCSDSMVFFYISFHYIDMHVCTYCYEI